MLRFPFAGLVLVVAFASGGCQRPLEEFSFPQYKFKAKFPGKPKEEDQGAGVATMKAFSVDTRNGAYMVGVADMPLPDGESAEMIQTRLDGARDGAVRNINGSLQSSNAVTLNGKYPGREFSAAITKPKQGQVRAKVFLVGKRMYMIQVIGTDSFCTSSQATEFLNSFVLTE